MYWRHKICPVAACGSVVKKITQHMKSQHPWLTETQVSSLARDATVAKEKGKIKYILRVKGQTSITRYTKTVAPIEDEYDKLAATNTGTRNFPQFDHKCLVPFLSWLTSPEGKLRSEEQAREICMDTSKLLTLTQPCP